MSSCTSVEVIYNTYTLPVINASAAISTTPLIYMYIKAYLNKQLKATTQLFYLGLTYYGIILISFIISIFRNWVVCHNNSKHLSNYLDLTNGTLYCIQSTLLIIILFNRLVHIFKTTPLALSRCLIHSFVSIIVAVAVLSSTCTISYNLLEEYSPDSTWLLPIDLLWGFLSLVYVISVIWLNAMFINKMYKVFRLEHASDKTSNKIVNIITKATVLCVISSISILLFVIPFFVWSVVRSYHILFVSNVTLVTDLYFNLLSVWLSNSCFDAYYFRMYGSCDKMCRKYIGGQTEDVRS